MMCNLMYNIIFYRLVSANFPAGHFTHIFLDESGHAIEPEAVIPIAGNSISWKNLRKIEENL